MALAAAALLCVALAGGWSLGGAAAGRPPGAAAGRPQFELAQRVGRTKQLESEAMREAALARLEAKVSRVCVCARNRRCLRAAAFGRAVCAAGRGAAPAHADAVLWRCHSG